MKLTKSLDMSNASDIVDYDDRDFVQYWDGDSKGLLHDSEARIIRDLLPQQRKWFIDLGCGFGRLVPAYVSDNQHTVLVDYSIEQLKIAADRVPHENVHLIAADACNLPFRDEVFDSGICIRLLHHIARPQHLMDEISRVLADRSCLLFNYMNRRSLLRILRYGADSFRHTHEHVSEVIYATHPKYYERLADEAGFLIQSMRGTGLMHQILHTSERMERCVNRHRVLTKLISFLELMADPVLGRSQLSLMQYARLEKQMSSSPPVHPAADGADFLCLLRCPACRCTELNPSRKGIKCPGCNRSFRKVSHIYDFRC